MRPPETVELKHGTRGVNVFLLSKLGCETFGSQLLYLWEITVNGVQFQVPHHSPTLAPALPATPRAPPRAYSPRALARVPGTCGSTILRLRRMRLSYV